jgi:hypothetical protein
MSQPLVKASVIAGSLPRWSSGGGRIRIWHAGLGRPGTLGHTTAGKRDSMLRQPPAAKLRACRGRRDPCGQRDAQLAEPMFHRSGPVRPGRAGSVRAGSGRAGAGRGGPGRGAAGRERANAFSRSPLVPRMVTSAAVGASDHRLIVTSMVSRRCTQAISDLAYGTGVPRIHHEARINHDNPRTLHDWSACKTARRCEAGLAKVSVCIQRPPGWRFET